MSEWKTLADRASAWVDSIDKMNRGEDPGDVPPPMPEPLARAFLELHAAVRRVCHDTDWCPVCEHHPSRGHAENCVVV